MNIRYNSFNFFPIDRFKLSIESWKLFSDKFSDTLLRGVSFSSWTDRIRSKNDSHESGVPREGIHIVACYDDDDIVHVKKGRRGGSMEEFEGRRGMLTTREWCNPVRNMLHHV